MVLPFLFFPVLEHSFLLLYFDLMVHVKFLFLVLECHPAHFFGIPEQILAGGVSAIYPGGL